MDAMEWNGGERDAMKGAGMDAPGAVQAAGAVGARVKHALPQSRSWAWGQRQLTRIAELQSQADVMRVRANGENQAELLAKDALKHLTEAEKAIKAAGNRRPTHAWEDTVTTNINAATCLIYRYAPLAEVQAMLPDVVATIDEQLPRTDLRRTAADDILRRLQKANGKAALTEAERGVIVAAVRTAYSALEREYLRIRSFRRLILVVSGFLVVIAAAIAVTAALYPTVLPICFTPEAKVVCATEEARLAGGDVDEVMATVASSWDYAVLELVGLVAAAVAAAATLRQVKGTSTPFDIPVALAILKLPTGALTALLGLLLMRGQFVPGLSNLDTSAQIVAWALVFGYAQQLFTRMVDERGQAVLAAVGGPENPKKP